MYELIQNAEDNSYSTAAAHKEEPFLAFKIYPDKIIVDSNEDGFSESNIRAICSVGNSTKKHSAGYIGEKGIGFKSVFKVAQKVHIQSGLFSCAFSHTRDDDDDGLGMITPYNEDSEQLPPGVHTRMTLTLLDSTKFDERASEFQGVPDTFLMFLSHLRRLSIELYPTNEPITAVHYSKRESKSDGLYTTFLMKTTRNDSTESSLEQKYYTMKSDLHNLPPDEARKDKEGNNIDHAIVILAFPMDGHDEPVLKPQYTYAFLPLRRVGFKFLIQSDFVTQANREDVVHSKRNQAVLKGVAGAFANAVTIFCQRPSLRYQWMRYLPDDSITDEFWKTLCTLVCEKLEQKPLLEPWSGKGLYKPSALEKLCEEDIDKDRNPLLPDIDGAEIYLSPKYTEGDFKILKRLGTKQLQWNSFIGRLEADLRKPVGSKWRTLIDNTDWRTQICGVLSRPLKMGEKLIREQKRLKMLALIPLRNGRWISHDSGIKVYFPATGSVSIPTDLGIDLVHPSAFDNLAWTDVLSSLGVMSCSTDVVISAINKRYDATTFDNFSISNAVAHIRYLFWYLPENTSSLGRVRLANHHGSLLKEDQYLYSPDENDDYSPSKLFSMEVHFPGYPVNYLHAEYLKSVDPGVIHHGRSWTTWLEEIAAVHRLPLLFVKGSDQISKEFQYIVNHRSDKLMGTLKRGWRSYRPLLNDTIKEKLQKAAVILENGGRKALEVTFLPLPKLKRIVEELHITDGFNFIAMSESILDEQLPDWRFVEDLLVGVDEDLHFYLSALDKLQQMDTILSSTNGDEQLPRLYRNIQSKCIEDLGYVRYV